VQDYIRQRGAGFTPDWFADTVAPEIEPNLRVKPMDDARVPQALKLLMNYKEFVDSWAAQQFGRGRYSSIIPTSLESWDLTDDEYSKLIYWQQPKDAAIKQAIDLLSAAGYSKSNPLKFEISTSAPPDYFSALVQLMQAQWRQNSQGIVDATIKNLESASGHAAQFNHTFTYGAWGQAGAFNDPDAWLSQVYRTGGSRNDTGYSDPQLDALIDKQRAIFDQKQRQAAVKEIVSNAAQHYPGVIPANRFWLNAVKPNIRNYQPEFWVFGAQYKQVWLAA
jgi:ABC-type transport system substrate-binding protein